MSVGSWQGKTYEQVLDEHRPAVSAGKYLGGCKCSWRDPKWADFGGSEHDRHLTEMLEADGFEVVDGEPRVTCPGPRAIRRRETAEAMLVTDANLYQVLAWLGQHFPAGLFYVGEEGVPDLPGFEPKGPGIIASATGSTVALPGIWLIVYEDKGVPKLKVLTEEKYRKRYSELGRT